MDAAPHVVIIGGGFAGLWAARTLGRVPLPVTLIDRRNHHLFQPLLYQVATGALSPANIASPLREILKRQRNTRILLSDVTDINAAGREIPLGRGRLRYEALIVAAGAAHNYFGHDDWQQLAPGLKDIEDATEMRRRILLAFEGAEQESDPEALAAWLTFVIIGAGPTGVELAGALAEIARDTLRHNFRRINPADARILLIEGAPRPLPSYPSSLSAHAARALARLGVTLYTGSLVTEIRPAELVVQIGQRTERIRARTILWAAGVRAAPLGAAIARATGCTLDRIGRVIVEPDLSVRGFPEVFVAGDLAHCRGPDGAPLPGLAPVAMQQGCHAARQILRRLAGRPTDPFRYRDRGVMATIGRGQAVAELGRLALRGFPAWLAWLLVHLMGLVAFQNRLLVLFQWGWSYLTLNRSARLITGAPAVPEPKRLSGRS